MSVTLKYGPYLSNGIIRHKTQRLRGLLKELEKEHYEVELVATDNLNRLSIEMQGREIFSCNLTNLCFNTVCSEDRICKRALDCIRDHKLLLDRRRGEAKFVTIKKGMRWYDQARKSSAGYFGSDINLLYEIGKRMDSDEHTRAVSDMWDRSAVREEEVSEFYRPIPVPMVGFAAERSWKGEAGSSLYEMPDSSSSASTFVMVCPGPCSSPAKIVEEEEFAGEEEEEGFVDNREIEQVVDDASVVDENYIAALLNKLIDDLNIDT